MKHQLDIVHGNDAFHYIGFSGSCLHKAVMPDVVLQHAGRGYHLKFHGIILVQR
ncbi:hypothetical protein SDC9_58491 [bioreactor metagenome]|uniref:Uncharacterized protein n=1 Tax=bioreactor metagenome TaxID=1076179 RepID=A0A644X7U2_9ZZZZ